MKNILLLVHEDAGQESRLQVALDVTRALDGHLECLDVLELPMIISDYYGTGYEAVMMDEVRERAMKNRKRLKARLATEDVSWTMDETVGTMVDALERASDLADLIILSARDEETQKHPRPERLPLKANRPLLAVPPKCGGLNASGNVLIACDGSRPCIESVRAAVPLLKCADEVALLEVNKPEGALAMAEIASYLSRHGIGADLVERATDSSVADAILKHADHRNAAYIVMGAYSRPRSAESVFGGVTRTMLLEANIPLLLAH